MRIIDRYICREILSHTLLGLAVFTFVFFVPKLVQLMDLVVRHSTSWDTLGLLFLCVFPSVLSFTMPIGVLVGVLIALGRMSADSELIAMSSLGMGMRRLLVPVMALAVAATLVTLAMTLWLGPASVRTTRMLEDRLRAGQASFQVTPRVFDERFPRLVLYVNDVEATATRWHGVFLAGTDTKDVARLTLAEEAIVIADRSQRKLDLHLRRGSIHEYDMKDPDHYSISAFGERDLPIELVSDEKEISSAPPLEARSVRSLLSERGPGRRDARVEVQRRFAFPLACISFALLAMPLGARPRRGGRAASFLITLLLISGYDLMFTVGAGLAKEGSLPVWIGIWSANIATIALGIALLPRMERMPGSSGWGRMVAAVENWRLWKIFAPRTEDGPRSGDSQAPAGGVRPRPRYARRSGIPQVLDLYMLKNFSYYFLLLTAGFVILFEVFTFFELLDDIALHRASLLEVLNYFRYLGCYMFYKLAPLAALVAALVTLGVMTKNNEIVAWKASGVSLYRLSLPLFLAGLAIAAGLVALDDTYLPYFNRQQDALHNRIKGRPPQTYLSPRRQWIFGENSKVYNYQLFDPDQQMFGGLSVYELNPRTFELRRRIFAQRARWDATQKTWILQSGWVRDFDHGQVSSYVPFLGHALAELNEPPSYFNREVRQYDQMTWWELRQYISDLRQAGFDVSRLSVQLQEKLSFPLIAPTIILLAIPFSVMVGTRGAVGGLALGVGLAFLYWSASALAEAMGAAGQLPPLIAGWSPDVIFGFLGLYFYLKMPT